jgi:hypothetical protein
MYFSYPKSESERINSLVEERSSQAACEFFENNLQLMQEKPMSHNPRELR